jgi:phage anti-repressor protein
MLLGKCLILQLSWPVKEFRKFRDTVTTEIQNGRCPLPPQALHVAILGIAKAVQVLKANSSRWMKEHGSARFEWQERYFACSVSRWQVATIRQYVVNQKDHHGRMDFAKEFKLLAKKHGLRLELRRTSKLGDKGTGRNYPRRNLPSVKSLRYSSLPKDMCPGVPPDESSSWGYIRPSRYLPSEVLKKVFPQVSRPVPVPPAAASTRQRPASPPSAANPACRRSIAAAARWRHSPFSEAADAAAADMQEFLPVAVPEE